MAQSAARYFFKKSVNAKGRKTLLLARWPELNDRGIAARGREGPKMVKELRASDS